MDRMPIESESKIFQLSSLDVTRGIAIFCMITYHFFTWWVNIELDFDLMVIVQIWGHLAAPLFLMILGIGQVFSTYFKKSKGYSEKDIRNYTIKRALWFFLISMIMNLFLEFNHLQINFLSIFSWHIFQILLFTTLFLYLIRKISIPSKLFIIGVIYCANIIIRQILNIQFIGMPYNLQFNTIYNIVGGLLFNGLFSPFPFLIFGILGSILGDYYIYIKENNLKMDSFWKYILVFGLIILISVMIIQPYLYTDYLGTRFIWFVRESYSATIFYIGLSLLVFITFYILIEVKKKDNIIFKQIKLYGKQPLTIFIFHYILGALIFSLIPIPLIRSMNLLQYAIITTSFFISWNILLIFWEKKKFRYNIDWIIKTYS